MKLREALREGSRFLKDCGIPDAEIDAWYLLEHLLGSEERGPINRAWYFLHCEEEMDEEAYEKYRALLEQRGSHIPLQHLTGVQEFMGLEFLVSSQVLIPRQDTEILVEEAERVIEPGMQVLDLCTGSGCVLLSLLHRIPGLLGTGCDLSGEALEVARKNAGRLQLTAKFRQGDLFGPVEGRYDVIVSNPPYIPTKEILALDREVRCHDPFLALDGREDGLHFYRRLAKESPGYLVPGGWLLLEIGCDQAEAVTGLLSAAGFRDISVVKDLAGLDRVVKGRREEE